MRTVIDFLNFVHREKQDYDKEKINKKPLEKALKTTKLMQLNEVIVRREEILSQEKFSFPNPIKPSAQKSTMVKVRFEITEKEYEQVTEYFKNNDISEVGREIFDYFLVREINNL